MSDARKIVDEIEAGKLEQAKQSVFDGIKNKAAETVDMKRVEKSIKCVEKSMKSVEKSREGCRKVKKSRKSDENSKKRNF